MHGTEESSRTHRVPGRPSRLTLLANQRWWSPYRVAGDASVLHLDLRPCAGREQSALSWLDAAERARFRKFQHEGARRRFVLCRAALRAILCERLGCDNDSLTFGEGLHEKPFALVDGAPAQVSFNLSHGGRHGLIALAPAGRLGVDAEERTTRRDFHRLIDAAFGPNEQAALIDAQGRPKVKLFFRLWTIKEALIKAIGTGLSFDPADFEAPAAMRLGAACSNYRFPQIPNAEWSVADLGCEDFAAAIAIGRNSVANSLTDTEIDGLLARAERSTTSR